MKFARHRQLGSLAPALIALLLTETAGAAEAIRDGGRQPTVSKPEDGASEAMFEPEPRLTEEEISEDIGRQRDKSGNWVDASHRYIGNRADDLAVYLDRFFGSPQEDLESADSNIRFITRLDWDQDDGNKTKFRLRGNVHLPRVNERLSLVLNGEDQDNQSGVSDPGEENTAGLQLNALQTKRSRFDLTLSATSGPNLKPGARYRYKDNWGDRSRFRYTGRADYSNDKRFRLVNNLEFDYLTGMTSLVRWSNRIEYGQRTEGTEWSSIVSWRYGYSLDSAFAWVFGLNGKSSPDVPNKIREGKPFNGVQYPPNATGGSSLLTNYGTILKFRNRLYSDWLYLEVEPGWSYRKRNNFEERHGVWHARINFEITFNRGREDEPSDTLPTTQHTGGVSGAF